MADYYSGGYGSAAAKAGVKSTDDVKKLQTELNAMGASLEVDGIYGPETDAAYGAFSAGKTNKTPKSADAYLTGVSEKTTGKLTELEKGYSPSGSVAEAKEKYESILENAPEKWTDPWAEAAGRLYSEMEGRKFSYDLNGDALWQQYRKDYDAMGKRAMENAAGRAAALTGGYGSTYAESAGTQAYRDYLTALGEKLPEFYEMALGRYEAESGELKNRMDALKGLSENSYDRWRDGVEDWKWSADAAGDIWRQASEQDYSAWEDALDYWTGKASAENADWWKNYEAALREAEMAAAGSGGSASGGSSSGGRKSTSGSTKKTEPVQLTKKEKTAVEPVTMGRVAKALDNQFAENEYGRWDLPLTRKQEADYYLKQGYIGLGEYNALAERYW